LFFYDKIIKERVTKFMMYSILYVLYLSIIFLGFNEGYLKSNV